MRKLLIIGILNGVAASAWCDCVQMSDHGLTSIDKDKRGMATVAWHGKFQNQCDDYVDVYITVDIIDADGDTLYSIRTIEALEYQEQVDIENDVYIPARVVPLAEDINISMKERKRQ